MKTYFQKETCAKCGKLFDSALSECPSCHEKCANSNEKRRFENMTMLGPGREISLLVIGFGGFQLIGLILSYVVILIGKGALVSGGLSGASLAAGLKEFENSGTYLSAVNFSSYLILFFALVALLGRDFYRLIARFKNPKTYWGLLIGVGSFLFSAIYGGILSNLGFSTNENQTASNEMVYNNPFLAILIFGFVGPFCEECTYRVGLFGFTKRINTVLAYVLCGIIFGLIHIHDFSSVNEWVTFPDYAIAGLIFALAYDKFGFGASYLAHVTTNLPAVIALLISQAAK